MRPSGRLRSRSALPARPPPPRAHPASAGRRSSTAAWYRAMAAETRLIPSVMGARTSARPAVKENVNGSSRHRRFLTGTRQVARRQEHDAAGREQRDTADEERGVGRCAREQVLHRATCPDRRASSMRRSFLRSTRPQLNPRPRRAPAGSSAPMLPHQGSPLGRRAVDPVEDQRLLPPAPRERRPRPRTEARRRVDHRHPHRLRRHEASPCFRRPDGPFTDKDRPVP
jgi:hypothetical protein